MKYAIEIRDLKKRFGSRFALNGLNLNVPQGSIFGLVGRNGAGKTTTLSIVAGLLHATSGEVNVMGNGLFDPVAHKGMLTILPQDARLAGHARVMDVLVYLAQLQGLSKPAARKSAESMLEWVNLSDRAESKLRTLSHGMLRRVTVAQAFLGSPDIVLLDEPVSGLDPEQVVQIRQLIKSRARTQTIVVSSHILSEIEAACDHVAFVEMGQTVRQDTLASVTGRGCLINYSLEPGTPPLDDIRRSLPMAQVEAASDGATVTVTFPEDQMNASEVNRAVLAVLLNSGAAIREVRMGSDLEQEYLKQI